MREATATPPAHYTGYGFEVMDLIEKASNEERFRIGWMPGINYFYLGNILKYILRAEFKGRKLEDLKKCLNYVERLEILSPYYFDDEDEEDAVECLKKYHFFTDKIEDIELREFVRSVILFYFLPTRDCRAVLELSLGAMIRGAEGEKERMEWGIKMQEATAAEEAVFKEMEARGETWN